MFLEIDSTEIIAYYASLNNKITNLSLPYQKITDICRKLEKHNRKVLACYDMISIDAFRCAFPKNVTLEKHQLVIKNINEIQSRLQRLEPSSEIKQMIVDIELEKDEKDT